MAEVYSILARKNESNNLRFAGIPCVLNKTAAAICDQIGIPVSVGMCRGKLDIAKPEEMLTLVLNVVDNAIHISRTPLNCNDIACMVISLPGNMDDWYARAFISEIKSIEPHLENTEIHVVSEMDVERYRISRGKGGFIINSGPQDIGFGWNARGDCYQVNGPGFGEKLAWETIKIVAGTVTKAVGLNALKIRFLDHFDARNEEQLKDIIGVFDPIERPSITYEILYLVADEAVKGNPLAHRLCTEATRRYCAMSEPVISNLHLDHEVFPISLRGGVFTVNPIFQDLCLAGMKLIAPNTYLAESSNEVGVIEAQMAIDFFFGRITK